MIHVCLCFTDKTGLYSKFAGTTMFSIFENVNVPRSVTMHILHDYTLTPDNRDKFIQVANRSNQLLEFHNVEKLCTEKLSKIIDAFPTAYKIRYTVGMFYRFLIPHVLRADIDKAIYLDTDIIVNLDINELWNVNLGDKVLGVVPSVAMREDTPTTMLEADGLVKREDYFNSGVLLMNLKLLREAEKILDDGMKLIGENPRYKNYLDQNVLNYCFASRTVKLPAKFNCVPYMFGRERPLKSIEKNIYHYATMYSLGLDTKDVFNRLWLEYFMRTPWFDADTIGRLYEVAWQNSIELMNRIRMALKITSIVAGKTRIFFVEPDELDFMKKIFQIHDDELIISTKDEHPFQTLLKAMRTSEGNAVVFIMYKRHLFNTLTKMGFVEGEHFVNCRPFLEEVRRTKTYNYKLTQAM